MRIDPNTRDVTLTEIEYRELINLKPDMDLEKAAEMSENIGQLNLEQAVDNYIANVRHFPDDEREIVMEIAQHFAEWQKEQMEERWLKDREGCFWDGVEEGKKVMKEQMLKEDKQ